MFKYSDFQNVEQFKKYYGLDKINEAKKEPEEEKVKEESAEQPEEEKENKKKSEKDQGDPTSTNPLDWKQEFEYSGNFEDYNCIFKKIIVFTNDRDPKGNKTLDNIYDAIKDLKKDKSEFIPEVIVFVADEVTCSENDEGTIHIEDSKGSIDIQDESNIDTLVFSRLGVQNTGCEQAVQMLQDRGFLVLNPVRYSKLASDKYETAVLLKKGNIPQPNFCLMTKDILYDEKSYGDALKAVHADYDVKGSDKNDDLEYVVKILDGHGGTGVACLKGKHLLAVLQMIFAIDPERRLIIQAKEEADGGDIRVHVLTLRNKQRILACMKRVKLSGDFRSNVSLGATAEPVKLTPEQEQIALRAAKLSHLPWCAVDIMPLVKGSNKELGDNVVLELNASPGTDGISEVMKENFISLLLTELDDPNEFYIQEKTAGYEETVEINLGKGPIKLLARLDTGNGTKASHFEVGQYTETDNKVSFKLFDKNYEFEKVDESHALAGSSEYNRPIIIVPELVLGKRKLKNIRMAVVESREKGTNVLLNRDVLSRMGYIINPNESHLLTEEMQKIKIL